MRNMTGRPTVASASETSASPRTSRWAKPRNQTTERKPHLSLSSSRLAPRKIKSANGRLLEGRSHERPKACVEFTTHESRMKREVKSADACTACRNPERADVRATKPKKRKKKRRRVKSTKDIINRQRSDVAKNEVCEGVVTGGPLCLDKNGGLHEVRNELNHGLDPLTLSLKTVGLNSETGRTRINAKYSEDTKAAVKNEGILHRRRTNEKPAPLLRTSQFCVTPQCFGEMRNHVVEDSHQYRYVYRNGSPTHLGSGWFGRVYLLQRGGNLFALKAFFNENTNIDAIKHEFAMLKWANEIEIGPNCFGYFPLVAGNVHYKPWGLLLGYLGDAFGPARTLGQFINEFNSRTCLTFSISEFTWIDIATQICEQMDALNRRGMAFRDITLCNIMVLQRNDELKVTLIDFGKANAMVDLSELNARVSSIDYNRVRYLLQDIVRYTCTKNVGRFREALAVLKNARQTKSWSDVIEALKKEKYFLRRRLES